MSNFPLDPTTFVGGKRVTPIDESEGGPPLAALLNSASLQAERVDSPGSDIDLSSATEAVVKAANRGVTANTGAPRSYTLPAFADAPSGWTHTMLATDANAYTVTPDSGDSINGVVDGSVALSSAHMWVTVLKTTNAAGWIALSAQGIVPA